MPNPSSEPMAPTTTVVLPTLNKTVTVNASEVPYLVERYGAVPPDVYAAQQAAAAKAGKSFPANLKKGEKKEGEKAPEGGEPSPPAE